MQIGIKKLLNRVDADIKKLSKTISDHNSKLDEVNINIDIKHILEDMRTILDYIAVDIYNKYCGPRNYKKIYFLYTKNGEDEQSYISKINRNFPNLYGNHYDLYKELSNVQSFSDNTDWLIKLESLTNEVKHNELCITKVKKERNTVMKSDNTSMRIKGNLDIQKTENGYGVFGEGAVYVGGEERVEFYSDGTITVGNGTYNFDTKKSNNLNTEIYYENSIKSKKYNEDIIELLWLIFNKESQLISNLESFI